MEGLGSIQECVRIGGYTGFTSVPCPFQQETHSTCLAFSGSRRGQRGAAGLGSLPTYLGHLSHGFLDHFRLIRQGFLLLLGSENRVWRGQGQGQLDCSSASAWTSKAGELGERLVGDPQGCALGGLQRAEPLRDFCE